MARRVIIALRPIAMPDWAGFLMRSIRARMEVVGVCVAKSVD